MSREMTEKKDDQKEIIKNASIVGVGTLLSRVAGLVRDQVTAFYFGAGPIADAFFVAFRIPNLLRRLLAEGALTPAFVPVFTERLISIGKDSASLLYRGVLTFMTLVLSAITLLGVIFAPYIVHIIAPGFAENPDQFALTVLLTRILFPYILLITLTALAMGVLNSIGKFNIPALGPVFLNISMIIGATLISPHLETPILGLAIGALLGGITQLLIQLPGLKRAGIGLLFTTSLKDPAIFKIFKLMAPTALGAAAYQISVFINTQLASFLQEGSVSWLYYADRLVQFPLGVFSLALATAMLPAMSKQIALGNIELFRDMFQKTLALQFFITLPAMVGLIVMSEPLVALLFERGNFTNISTIQTALALWGFSLGLPFLSGASLAARVFYSLSNTKTPAKVAAVSLGIGVILAIVLMGPLKHVGLALASSIASFINFTWLCILLKKRGELLIVPFLKDFCLSTFLAFVMGLVLWPLYHMEYFKNFNSLSLVILGLIIGPFVYFSVAYLLRSPNIKPLKDALTKFKEKFKRKKLKDV